MPKVLVLSNREQYDAVLERGLELKDFMTLCDNERFYPFLDQKGLPYEILSEMVVQSRWAEMNAWGWGKASSWIKITSDNGFFKDSDFPSVIFLWFVAVLLLMLKNYLYAEYVIEKYKPTDIVIFESQSTYSWPEFSGNDFLNHFLAVIARSEGLPIETVKVNGTRTPILPDTSSRFKRVMRSWIKKVIHKIYGSFIHPSCRADVMIFGTLRHLASTAVELKRKGASVFLYDSEFRFDQFLFAFKNKIPYLIPQNFLKQSQPSSNVFVAQILSELSGAMRHPVIRDHFVFEAYNFGEFIEGRLFSALGGYLLRLSDEAGGCNAILKSCQVSAVLLDEDFNAHAFLAAFMKRRGVALFCISHANTALDSRVALEERCFAHSDTFVHSEHESDNYKDAGWVAEKIFVTGTPRYDRLIGMVRNTAVPGVRKGNLRILFSAAYLWPFSPDNLGFIGSDIYGFRHFQEQSLRALFRAADGLPVTVILKPHYTEDEGMWHDFVRQARPNCNVQIVKASEDFFNLLVHSHAMAICSWSSTLIEAGISRVPVFYLDLEGQNSDQVKRLEESGLCKIIRNVPALKNSLEFICRQNVWCEERPKLTSRQEYYLGNLDGQASSRVADFILTKLKDRENVAI